MRAALILALARTIRWASVGAGSEKRAGDLLGGEAADFAQGECDLRVGRQGRVTAGEDEAEPVVLDLFVVHLVRRGDAVAQTIGYQQRARRRTGLAGGARLWP